MTPTPITMALGLQQLSDLGYYGLLVIIGSVFLAFFVLRRVKRL